MDRLHYQALQARAAADPALREEFARAMAPAAEAKEAGAWATIALLPGSGDCPLLGPDRLCTLQTRLGEELLPNACAQYPRYLGQVGERREMWGLLSCPEMVRQCLLTEDGMQLAEAPPFPRPIEGRTLASPERPYERHLDDIRATVLGLLSLRGFPIAVRFFFLARFADRTRPFFHHDAETLDLRRLATEIVRLQDAATLDAWHAAFQKLRLAPKLGAALVASILANRADRNLAPLVARVLGSYAEAGTPPDALAARFAAEPLPLWTRYLERRRIWEERFSRRVDLYFENHAKSYWLREWYVSSPNLLVHLQTHLCQVAVARFLLFGHPDLLAAAGLPDRAAQEAALDRAAVEAFSRVSRALEHRPEFIRELQAELAKGGMQDLAHATLLAAV